MATKEINTEAKPPGPISRIGLYAYISQYSKEAIDKIVHIMRTTRNESLALGAAKAILDKSLPDIKAVELTGEGRSAVQIRIVSEDYGTNKNMSKYGLT